VAHRLAGSAAVYGLESVSDAARAAEEFALRFRDGHLGPDKELSELLNDLARSVLER